MFTVERVCVQTKSGVRAQLQHYILIATQVTP
jgi:hypothetical protein